MKFDPHMNEEGEFHMKSIQSQDRMAWETPGPIYNRAKEHLGESDQGVILYRQILGDQIAIVQKGGDPMALVRDPDKNRIIELTITERLPSEEEQIVFGRDDNFFEWAPANIIVGQVNAQWRPTEQLRVNLLYNHQQYIRPGDGSNVGLRRIPRLPAAPSEWRALRCFRARDQVRARSRPSS